MNRHTTLLLTTLLLGMPACDKAAESEKKDSQASNKPAPEPSKPEVASPEVEPAKPVARVAASGLDLGMRFAAFDIVNCDSGDKYCQVCKFGGSPKIMAVGTIDDPEFRTDLQNLDALVQKYGEDKVKAFAVITDIKDGKSSTPLAEREALIAKVKALKTELGVKLPMVVPATADDAHKAFDDYYNVTKSRTLMFADGRNSVKYSAVAPKDLSALNTAIQSVVAPAATAAPAAG